MSPEEFFRELKKESSELVSELAKIKEGLDLQNLYLIYINEKESAWGFRNPVGESDQMASFKKLAAVLCTLYKFLKTHTGLDYNPATGEKRIVVFYHDEYQEVEYVIHNALLESSLQYKGVLEILGADEKTGKVLLTIDSNYQEGVKNTLKHLLPWVKEVLFSNDKNDKNETIVITEKAAKKIKEIMDNSKFPQDCGVQFGLKAGGCSGMQYEIKAEMSPKEDDKVFEKIYKSDGASHTARIFINPPSLKFLAGSIIDYGLDHKQHNFTETFLITNPNEKGSCGCGQSPSF